MAPLRQLGLSLLMCMAIIIIPLHGMENPHAEIKTRIRLRRIEKMGKKGITVTPKKELLALNSEELIIKYVEYIDKLKSLRCEDFAVGETVYCNKIHDVPLSEDESKKYPKIDKNFRTEIGEKCTVEIIEKDTVAVRFRIDQPKASQMIISVPPTSISHINHREVIDEIVKIENQLPEQYHDYALPSDDHRPKTRMNTLKRTLHKLVLMKQIREKLEHLRKYETPVPRLTFRTNKLMLKKLNELFFNSEENWDEDAIHNSLHGENRIILISLNNVLEDMVRNCTVLKHEREEMTADEQSAVLRKKSFDLDAAWLGSAHNRAVGNEPRGDLLEDDGLASGSKIVPVDRRVLPPLFDQVKGGKDDEPSFTVKENEDDSDSFATLDSKDALTG